MSLSKTEISRVWMDSEILVFNFETPSKSFRVSVSMFPCSALDSE